MTLATQLELPAPRLFVAVKIAAPFGTQRLLDGAGTVVVDSETYTGEGSHGVLSVVESFSDGVAAEAPRVRLTMQFTDTDLIADYLDPELQGSAVTLYEGVLGADGVVVEEPEPAFVGEVDIVKVAVPFGGMTVEIDVASVFERFFDNNEGSRLSSPWHQSFWPGELGLDQVTGINCKLPWGVGGGGTGFKGQTEGDFQWWKGDPLLQKTALWNPLG